jgi:hypothetical protein
MAVNAASHRPSAHSPRIPASSYANRAASRHAERTVSAKTRKVWARCDTTGPRAHEMRETLPVTRNLPRTSHRRAIERRARYLFYRCSFSLRQRLIAPGDHLVTDGCEFRRGQHAAS